ncbi:hypothetical protein HJFPF1_00212 [Paramyrothecium foliicola]|nr:hypothetical protein HJFPF1_00212 [Paramyrothecium foliicola]
MKALMIFGISECVGQWKWILFSRKERRLMDFERIDLASRGPLGSSILVWRRATPLTLRLGVSLIMIAILIEPFTQQLVQVQPGFTFVDNISGVHATIARSTGYRRGWFTLPRVYTPDVDFDDKGRKIAWASTVMDVSLEAAILTALSGSMETVKHQVEMHCPSASCTWLNFNTLGVCHRCTDLTSRLQKVDDFGEVLNFVDSIITQNRSSNGHQIFQEPFAKEDAVAFALPNGHFIANPKGSLSETTFEEANIDDLPIAVRDYRMTSFGTSNPSQTITMADLDTLIWSMSFIYKDYKQLQELLDQWSSTAPHNSSSQHPGDDNSNGRQNKAWQYWPNVPLQARECALYYCVKSINSSVEGNVLQENVSEATDFSRDPNSWQPTKLTFEDYHVPEAVPLSDEGLYSLEFSRNHSGTLMEPLKLRTPSNSDGADYIVSQGSVKSISAYFQDSFRIPQLLELQGAIKVVEKLGRGAVGFNGLSRSKFVSPELVGGTWAGEETSVVDAFEKLATAMTNAMRSQTGASWAPIIAPYNRVKAPTEEIPTPEVRFELGLIKSPNTLYKVKWYWISLHASLVLGGSIFCIITIRISTTRDSSIPSFKSSSLATMCQSFHAARILAGAETLPELNRRAKSGAVILVAAEQTEVLPLDERPGQGAGYEGVGQWKWILFSQTERRLVEFERIDLASRGPLGSFSLIWRKSTPYTLRLGSGMIILAVAVEPFAQQLIQLEPGSKLASNVNDTQATIPYATKYDSGMLCINKISAWNPTLPTAHAEALLDFSMENAIRSALSRSSSTLQQVNVHCPNLTSDMKRVDGFGDFLNFRINMTARYWNQFQPERYFAKGDSSAFVLPNGHFIAGVVGHTGQSIHYSPTRQLQFDNFQMTSFGTSNPSQTVSMSDTKTMIWSMSFMYEDHTKMKKMEDDWQNRLSFEYPNHEDFDLGDPTSRPWAYWPEIPMRADECALYYCVKSIEAKWEDNVLMEKAVELETIRDPKSWQPRAWDGDPIEVYAQEDVPMSDDGSYSLEFNEKHSMTSMTSLELRTTSSENNSTFSMGDSAIRSISSYFQKSFRDD